MRKAEVSRKTKETQITVSLNLNETLDPSVETGVGFFDHMLSSLGFHSGFSLKINARGDLDVDQHHTVEDVGIALGDALAQALGDKKGIRRFGFASVPMDEALAKVSLDISGRPLLEIHGELPDGKVGDFDAALVVEFLRGLANHAAVTLHVEVVSGQDKHHTLEAVFKALGRALKDAVSTDSGDIPSTKGVL